MTAMQKNSPLISVILPVYNAERYVGQAIESILGQTLGDFELIVIDDGSTDASSDVIKRYAAQDRRIVSVSRENRGLVATLNAGIDLARGQWIARIDADDIALPNRFERQLAHLRQTGADPCGGAVQFFGDRKAVWRYPISHEECEAQLLLSVPFAHPTVIGRKELFATLRYDPAFETSEDYDLWQRAWAAGYRMVNVPDVVLRYRVHGGQVSVVKRVEQTEHTAEIRKRHWKSVLRDASDTDLDDIIAAFDGKPVKLAGIAPLFKRLISLSRDEGVLWLRSVLFRIFCKQAAYQTDAALIWYSLLEHTSPKHRYLCESAVIYFLSAFKLEASSRLFSLLKNIYYASCRL
jgi:glycosyltransferase involved in cell wall biosynthesis